MGRRDQQKEQRREAMLRAAAILFARDGYAGTTMERVAERAGVGVATVYNYFGSKENIVRELTVPDLERIFEDNERLIQDPPADAADAVVALLCNLMTWCNSWQDRNLLRLVSVPGMPEYQGSLGDLVEWADAKATEQIRDLLRVLQLRGQIPTGVNVADMATVVFSVFNQEFIRFVMHDQIPPERVFADTERLVRTLFSPWRAEFVPGGRAVAGKARRTGARRSA